MLDRLRILALIPHQGAMCLLDSVARWGAGEILCHTRSHLDPGNPLRRAGRLDTGCGIEYGLQAAALHGVLLGGGVPQAFGFLAALRSVTLNVARLDDPILGLLQVTARLEGRSVAGLAYGFRLAAERGDCVLEGRGLIALPKSA